MSNTGIYLREIDCKDREICTSSEYYCKTCLRNKANIYSDKFSLKKGGYDPLNKWFEK